MAATIETKEFKLAESKKNIDKISGDMTNDERKFSSMARFGYFSIPYSAYYGDRHYSQDRSKVYRTEDRKVITEARGVFTKPGKKGKFVDAYFSNDFKQDIPTLNRVSEMAKKEREEYLAKVRSGKKGGEGAKSYKSNFKPTGPQEYKDFYDINPVTYTIPIDKEIDKKTKIDKEHRSVFTENRGIYTKPAKKGTAVTPGVLFGYFPEDPKLLSMKEKWAEEAKPKKRSSSAKDGKEFKQSFRPAALKKNDPFHSDKAVYGEDDARVRELLASASETRHKGAPKYEKKLPPGALKQQFAFKPPALLKTGKESLFSPVYGVPYIGHEKTEIKKKSKEEKEFKKSFRPNRLKDSSVFSPPVTSFLTNLKKEFPRVFHK